MRYHFPLNEVDDHFKLIISNVNHYIGYLKQNISSENVKIA